MKRFIHILLCVLMAASLVIPSGALAEAPVDRSALEKITTPHVILMEADSNAVLFEKAAYEKAYPASTTKIMTCILALENASNVDALYTCGWEAVNGFGSASSLLGLKRGYKVTIKDMLYGLMLCSGNDCGACLAFATAGSMEGFVELMNKKAEELGMTGTHYMNAHGLHNEEHYTTAYDMALLMKYALKNETFREIIATKEYTVKEAEGKFEKTIYTSNKLLLTKEDDWQDNIYEYAIGGKTGETNDAGFCLVEAAEKDGVTLITVTMGDNNMGGTDKYYRFRNAKLLFNYGFAQYVSYDLAHYNVPDSFNIKTVGYDTNDINDGFVTARVDYSSVVISGNIDDLAGITEASFSWDEPVLDEKAIVCPVEVGTKLGTVTLRKDGEPFFTGDIYAVTSVNKAGDAEPTQTASNLFTSEPNTVSRDEYNLTLSKNGGDAQYTEWIYYMNTMFTTEDGIKNYFLFYDGEVFKSARKPGGSYQISLYKKVTEGGEVKYVYADEPEDGGEYVVVSQGMALTSQKKGRTLSAAAVTVEGDRVTSEVTEDILWTFKAGAMGFLITSGELILHRTGGDGLLFWILIGILVIGLIIVIRLLITGRKRRRNPHRKGQYKIYRM